MVPSRYNEEQKESPDSPTWKFTSAEGSRIVWLDYAKPKKR